MELKYTANSKTNKLGTCQKSAALGSTYSPMVTSLFSVARSSFPSGHNGKGREKENVERRNKKAYLDFWILPMSLRSGGGGVW